MSVIRLHLYLHAKIRKCVAIIGVIFGGGDDWARLAPTHYVYRYSTFNMRSFIS